MEFLIKSKTGDTSHFSEIPIAIYTAGSIEKKDNLGVAMAIILMFYIFIDTIFT